MTKSRKITFPNVGIIKGSRVWRNLETGVEIIKGKNFKEVGLYYVCVPTAPRGHDGAQTRRMVAHRTTFKAARSAAEDYAAHWRVVIGRAHEEAILENEGRAIREANQMDQIDAWWRRHDIHGSTDYAASILAAREADHAEALIENAHTLHYRSTTGFASCGGMFSVDGMTENINRVTCQECRDRHSSRYWERATEGMARVPAF